MNELIPCPFCRTSGIRLIDLWGQFDAGHIAHVHCEKCGAFGPSEYSEGGADEAILKARAAWNDRGIGEPG